MSIADEIKGRINIVDYIQQVVPLKRAGRTWKAPCPFHSEKTPSFVVNEDRQSWRCFGQCATGGDVFAFAMRYHGWSFNEALQELGKQVGVEVRQRSPEQRQQDEQLDRWRGLLQEAAEAYHLALFNPSIEGAAEALTYTRTKRGFSDETIYQYGIGYAPPGWSNMRDHLATLGYNDDDLIAVGLAVKNDEGRVYDRFRHRLMIPIRDERGRVTGFGARALAAEDNPKYLNSPQTVLFDKSKTLFAFDTAKRMIDDTGTAVIVEGYMDALQAHQAGFRNVVAQMGTALTETQLKMLVPRHAKVVILALDADAAGQNATLRSLEVARQTLVADYAGKLAADIRILSIPGAKDPDDLLRETPQQWPELVKAAKPAAEFVMEVELAQLPPNATVQQREAAARRLLPLLSVSQDRLYSRDNVQKLALRLRIPERDLLSWADEQQQIKQAAPPRSAVALPEAPPEEPPPAYASAPPPRLNPNAQAEAYCLRLLLQQQPKAYYEVNRKLREIANGDAQLLAHTLGGWSAQDFATPTLQALMNCIQDGLAQTEQGLYEFVRGHLHDSFLPIFEQLFEADYERVHSTVRGGMAGDMIVAWRQSLRGLGAVDMSAELTEKVLRLRLARLQREREELFFLQTETQMSGDTETAMQFLSHSIHSLTAKRLIESELDRMASNKHDAEET